MHVTFHTVIDVTPAGLLTLYITNEKQMGQCHVSIHRYIIIYYTVMNAK